MVQPLYSNAFRLRQSKEPRGQTKTWGQPGSGTGGFRPSPLGDQKNDNPEQFRAIGWCLGRLHSVIFEIIYDSEGEYYHLITPWRATKEEEQMYAKTPNPTPSADQIAELATRGEDVSAYFTNKFKVFRPIRRVNIDLTRGMLRELD